MWGAAYYNILMCVVRQRLLVDVVIIAAAKQEVRWRSREKVWLNNNMTFIQEVSEFTDVTSVTQVVYLF